MKTHREHDRPLTAHLRSRFGDFWERNWFSVGTASQTSKPGSQFLRIFKDHLRACPVGGNPNVDSICGYTKHRWQGKEPSKDMSPHGKVIIVGGKSNRFVSNQSKYKRDLNSVEHSVLASILLQCKPSVLQRPNTTSTKELGNIRSWI